MPSTRDYDFQNPEDVIFRVQNKRIDDAIVIGDANTDGAASYCHNYGYLDHALKSLIDYDLEPGIYVCMSIVAYPFANSLNLQFSGCRHATEDEIYAHQLEWGFWDASDI